MSEKDFCEGYLLGIMGGALPFEVIPKELIDITPPISSELYIYGDMVLYSPTWDIETYPSAIMSYETGQTINFYFSKNSMYCETKNRQTQAVMPGPTYRYEYDYETGSWTNLTNIQESIRFSEGKILWSNKSLIKPNGSYFFEAKSPEKFEYNKSDKPTAFLNKNGALQLRPDTFYDRVDNVLAIFVNWEDKEYDTLNRAPWLRFHQDRISSVSIIEGVNPKSTDAWFYMCENLSSAAININLEEIGERMFQGTKIWVSNINNILLKAKRVGDYAFQGIKLRQGYLNTTLYIPENIDYIGKFAFSDIGDVDIIEIRGATEIGSYAFADNRIVYKVIIGEKTRKIYPYAFETIGLSYWTGHHFDEKCAKVFFEDTEGWWVSKDKDATEGMSVDVTNPRQNGINISCFFPGKWNSILGPTPPVEEGKYKTYYWFKNENINGGN